MIQTATEATSTRIRFHVKTETFENGFESGDFRKSVETFENAALSCGRAKTDF